MRSRLLVSSLLLLGVLTLSWLGDAPAGPARAGPAGPPGASPVPTLKGTTATPTLVQPPSTPVPAVTGTPGCPAVWNIVASPNIGLGDNYLMGVAAVAADDMWAVGYYSSSTSTKQTLIEHWDGVQWIIASSPNIGLNNNRLLAVAAITNDDVWAVGSYENDGPQPLALHWNGQVWAVIPIGGSGVLNAVAGITANAVWTVGYSGPGSGSSQPLVESWNGAYWSRVSAPAADANVNIFYGLTVRALDDAWAVGTFRSENQLLVEHWDGQQWSILPCPNPWYFNNIFYGVAALAPNNLWAVGVCCHDTEDSLAYQWDGTRWYDVRVHPLQHDNRVFYGVAAHAANDGWAVGWNVSSGTMISHWDGSQWTTLRDPLVPRTRVLRSVVARTADDVWAVGYDGYFIGYVNRTTVVQYRPACPTTSPTPTPCPIQFSDVPATHPFYAYIRCLSCQGVVAGYADGTFRPGANVTRSQVSKIIALAARLSDPVASTQQTFSDVPPTQPFWRWIEQLAGRAVISGYSCGGPGELCDPSNRPYFRPGNPLIRSQLAKIVSATTAWADAIPATQATFADVPPSHPFWLYIERAVAHGVISGYACGGPGEPCAPQPQPYYRPGANVTRGQTAKIVANTFFSDCQVP